MSFSARSSVLVLLFLLSLTTSTEYKDLIGVDKDSITHKKQPDPTETVHKISLEDFKKAITKKEFPEEWMELEDMDYDDSNGITFAFVVMADARDEMRTMALTTIGAKAPGHSSMVSKEEYAGLKAGTVKMVYAGELGLNGGYNLKWWSSRSGHFLPDIDEHKTFAKHWGLEKIKYNEIRSKARMEFYDMYSMDADQSQQQQTQSSMAMMLEWVFVLCASIAIVMMTVCGCCCVAGFASGYILSHSFKYKQLKSVPADEII